MTAFFKKETSSKVDQKVFAKNRKDLSDIHKIYLNKSATEAAVAAKELTFARESLAAG